MAAAVCRPLVLVALSLAAGAAAQPAPRTGPPALAADLARSALPALEGLSVEHPAIGLRLEAALPPALVTRLEESLRQALSDQGRLRVHRLDVGATPEAAAEAARAAGDDALVHVRLALEHNLLGARVQVLRVRPGLWETFLDPRPRPPVLLAEGNVSSRLDAGLRALLGPSGRWPSVPLARPRLIATPFRGTVALLAADLDGDGHDEIVLAGTDRLRVARLTAAGLSFPGDLALPALGWASVPLRQPLGSMSFLAASRHVLVRTSAQASMGELSWAGGAFALEAAGGDLYPASGEGCVALAPGSDQVREIVPSCRPGEGPAGAAGAPLAAVPVAVERPDAQGIAHRVEARADGAGACEVRVDGARVALLTGVAPPLWLEDIDEDGRVELLASSATAPEGADRLRVFTLDAGGVLERTGFGVPGPIEALSAGDIDGDGYREVLVSQRDPQRHVSTLWVLP